MSLSVNVTDLTNHVDVFDKKQDGDNLVKYVPLSTALGNYNTAVNGELTKIQAAISALGGAYALQPLTLDVSGAKVDNLKTD